VHKFSVETKTYYSIEHFMSLRCHKFI